MKIIKVCSPRKAATLITVLLMLLLGGKGAFASTESVRLSTENHLFRASQLPCFTSVRSFFCDDQLLKPPKGPFANNRRRLIIKRLFELAKIAPSSEVCNQAGVETSTKSEISNPTEVQLTFHGVVISYCSEHNFPSVIYKGQDKQYEMQLMAEERMGLLIEANSAEFIYSLRFLGEDEKWPTQKLLAEKTCRSKFVIKVPGWVVCMLMQDEPKTGAR